MNRAIFFVVVLILAFVSSIIFYSRLDNLRQTELPAIVQDNLAIGNRAVQIQKYNTAAEAYTAALELDPTNKAASEGIRHAGYAETLAAGDALLRALQFSNAINAYERAALIFPASPQTAAHLTRAVRANDFADYLNWLRPKAERADEILKLLDNDHPQYLIDGTAGYSAQPDVTNQITQLQKLQAQCAAYSPEPQFRQAHSSFSKYIASLLTGMYEVNSYLRTASVSPGQIKADFDHAQALSKVYVKDLQAAAAKNNLMLQQYTIKSIQP